MTGARPIEAVIFDLDGVLADTESLWHRATCDFVAPAEVLWDEYVETIGVTTPVGLAWIKQRYNRPESIDELDQLLSTATYHALEEAALQPMEGAYELIDALRDRGLPIAVASQSSARWVARTLELIGLRDTIPTIVTTEEVARGKPAPDIYLQAAERLGADPRCSIAIEDSAPGIAAGVAAGMSVVQLRAFAYCPPQQPGVHYVIESLASFDLGWLDGVR